MGKGKEKIKKNTGCLHAAVGRGKEEKWVQAARQDVKNSLRRDKISIKY